MNDNIDAETKIIDELIYNINKKKYDKNDRLPSENDLADIYKVPRIVVRKAYERLQEMGYIYSKWGKGRFLKHKHELIDLVLSGDKSFSEKMIKKGYDFLSKNVCFKRIKYNRKIFTELNADAGDKIYKVARLRIIDHIPMALHVSYVSSTTFPNIENFGDKITSMFEYYRNNGYSEFMSSKSILSVSFPTEGEREILKCRSLIPLLILETNSCDAKTKKILEYTKILYRSDHFKYIIK
ncbi:MAG TPA: GntR family transcriptional regulator [Clostridium sp.]|mgnify:CR=1 FL=1|jgi:GntR family transcriptional regulator|uniref:GntR family transcriptional regulator n=1 Tax=Clostridium lapidicellarium TaxID=3240931 RepID=A0ABV4DU68_9CLOT|nr:GntR family transcriptional regulator [uncultured Clostridium sp.]HBC96755.1 GntR family transcriptional regulator [Clostridium sp.]